MEPPSNGGPQDLGLDKSLMKDLTARSEAIKAPLITSLKVINFMGYSERTLETNHPLAFQDETEQFRSVAIVAVMLGLGYDLVLENYSPATICGWKIKKDVVHSGYNQTIELVLCLSSCLELQAQYGTHLKLERLIYKGVPLGQSKFVIRSADLLKRIPSTSEVIDTPDLRTILRMLKIFPVYLPLLHLDCLNLKEFLKYPDLWYDVYQQIVKSREDGIRDKIKALEDLRKTNNLNRQNAMLNFHQAQLRRQNPEKIEEHPQNGKFENTCFVDFKKELDEIRKKQMESIAETAKLNIQLLDVAEEVRQEMDAIYCKFLKSSRLGGGILFDDEAKKIGPWVKDLTFIGNHDPPSNLDEANAEWNDMMLQMKRLGIIALYLAFWNANQDCPIFSVDLRTTPEQEFRLPKNGIPVLMEIIGNKWEMGQQFFYSPPSPS